MDDTRTMSEIARPPHGAEQEAFQAQLALTAAKLKETTIEYDERRRTLIVTIHFQERPCFSINHMLDYQDIYADLRAFLGPIPRERRPLQYLVHTSSEPGIWCLGGDLALFSQSIKNCDPETLRHYAHACVRVGYETHIGLDLSVITICLVRGQALGGGLEAATSCNLVFAEKGPRATFGLPEIKFNLFPGMGALTYLPRRIGMRQAEAMVRSGKSDYTAEEMHAMGVVDHLCEEGQGLDAVLEYIDKNSRRHNAHAAIYAARQRALPITYEELRDITDLWVDCALGLSPMDLRLMEKLVASQRRLRTKPEEMIAAE